MVVGIQPIRLACRRRRVGLTRVVASKWADTGRWPHVNFAGGVMFENVEATHRTVLAMVLLLARRNATCGHLAQRLFEAVPDGCAPITPR